MFSNTRNSPFPDKCICIICINPIICIQILCKHLYLCFYLERHVFCIYTTTITKIIVPIVIYHRCSINSKKK